MIGKIFLIYNILVLFFVYIEYLGLFNDFIDYYSFGLMYKNEFLNFMIYYSYSLFIFFIGWYITKNKKKLKNKAQKKILYSKNIKTYFISLFLMFFNISMLFLEYGSDVFSRTEYHPEHIDYGIFYILYTLSLLIGLAFVGVSKYIGSIFSIILILIIVIFSYSISTRLTGVILLLIAFINYKNSRKVFSLFLTILGIISLILATYFRSQKMHGLEHYLQFTELSEVIEMIVPVISYAFNFSFHLAVATYHDYNSKGIKLYDFIVSLNPLPGHIAGWYGFYQEKFLVQYNVPSSAFGSFLATGWFISSILFFCLGVIISLFDNYSERNKSISIIILVLGFIFIVYFSQYQMRSAFRYLYYILFIIILYKVFKKKKLKKF
jgi:hypothetical protein